MVRSIDASRRSFLGYGGAASAAAAAALTGHPLLLSSAGLASLARAAHAQQAANTGFRVLTEDEARELEAIAERILPATDSPGAREAGVIFFFDQTLGTFNAGSLEALRDGLKAFEASVPDGKRFSELAPATQDAYLKTREQTGFFGLCRFMTLCGYFGMSRYGGNRGDAGWKLVGMSPHPQVHIAPFGYYDAAWLKEHGDA